MSDELPTATRVSDPGIRALYQLENRWQAWLDVEVALAKAQAELGIIPAEAAEAIAKAAQLRTDGPRPHRRGLRPHRPHHRAAGLGTRRIVGEPHGGWVHWGATTQNITQTGDLLVLRQAHGIFLRQIGEVLSADGRPRRTRRRHADARPHPRPARGAGHLRLQGRGLDRRVAAPCRAPPPGRAAPVRRHAGRRRRHLRLARQAGAAGAGRDRQAARLRHDDRAVARARRPPRREHLPARPAGRDLRQDRPRDLHADEDRVRRGRGAGAARHRRQLDHAAEAQSETVPGHHRRGGGGARDGAAGAGSDDDRARGRPHHQPDDGFAPRARACIATGDMLAGWAKSCAA